MNYKPMLACDSGDIEKLRYPLMASPKLDGVRAIITHDGVLSRSLKPIPNKNVQAFLDGLPVGLDGELIVGPPTAPDAYRRTVSVVMSDDADITGLAYYVFDVQDEGTALVRQSTLRSAIRGLANASAVQLVPQTLIQDAEGLAEFEELTVGEGYEGVIIRSLEGTYKHGRSTAREGYLLKLKRFEDSEAEVIGVEEMNHNENEAKVNELGRTDRGHKKAGMVPAGVMGKLIVTDVKTGVEFKIGSGFTAADRKAIWEKFNVHDPYGELEKWPLVKYKHQPCGAKDKPRIPIFLGWRDKMDV